MELSLRLWYVFITHILIDSVLGSQEAQQEAKSQIESMYSSPEFDQADRVRGYNGTNYRMCAIPEIEEEEDNPEEEKLKILTRETIFEWYRKECGAP